MNMHQNALIVESEKCHCMQDCVHVTDCQVLSCLRAAENSSVHDAHLSALLLLSL